MAQSIETHTPSGAREQMLSLFGKSWSGVAMLGIFYLILIAVFSVLSPYFLTLRNMLQIGGNVAYIGLMAAAGTPLIIAGDCWPASQSAPSPIVSRRMRRFTSRS